MAENLNQPRDYDAVKGGNNSPPLTGVVLGGLPGVKHRLASSVVEVRLAALKDVLNYRQGVKARSIYNLERQEPETHEVIGEFNLYLFFRCVHTLRGHNTSVSLIAISPNAWTLASTSYDNTIKLW